MSNLSNDLWIVALDTATAFGFSIAPRCEMLLRELLEEGASTVEASTTEVSEPEKLAAAKANTMLFVTSMVAEARRRGDLDLRDQSFFAVRDRICPLWPFC